MLDLEFDRDHLWHPYTSLTTPLPTYPVASALGSRLRLTDGRELIDGMSSWWVAIHGYSHPSINEALTVQLSKLAHVMFGGITHEPAIKLGKLLHSVLPPTLTQLFYCDSGSIAVEVALKICIIYWQALGKESKKKFLTVRSGYHGDTLNAMSVSDPHDGKHFRFRSLLPINLFAEPPQTKFCEQKLRPNEMSSVIEILETEHENIAGVIIEPIMQGIEVMNFYSPTYLQELRTLCDIYQLPLIFDEIATGFGRTGKIFALEHAQVVPDVICMGKGLTGGYVSLAAVATTKKISDTIGERPLEHGGTYMANPLACSAAIASTQLLIDSDFEVKIKEIENLLFSELSAALGHKEVSDVRSLGAVGVIQCKSMINVAKMQSFFVDKGVWIRPYKNLLYIMPPYVITNDELKQLTTGMLAALEFKHFFYT
jgi:adenosylmethionine---8-amino-7-oxononanoate aminotransferase